MATIDRRPETTTTDLIREAIDESRALLNVEVALAKDEVRREIASTRAAMIAFAVAALLGTLGLASALVALLLALLPRMYPAPVAGGIFLVTAVITALVGYRFVPKHLMGETRAHIESDVRVFKERSNEKRDRVESRVA